MSTKKGCTEWGFDLTGFKDAETFRQLLKRNGLTKYKKECDEKYGYCKFTWKNKGIKIITGNNPITGEFSNKGWRKPEKGYASYIGITGEPEKVEKLVKDIKRTAQYIKDESECRRDFI